MKPVSWTLMTRPCLNVSDIYSVHQRNQQKMVQVGQQPSRTAICFLPSSIWKHRRLLPCSIHASFSGANSRSSLCLNEPPNADDKRRDRGLWCGGPFLLDLGELSGQISALYPRKFWYCIRMTATGAGGLHLGRCVYVDPALFLAIVVQNTAHPPWILRFVRCPPFSLHPRRLSCDLEFVFTLYLMHATCGCSVTGTSQTPCSGSRPRNFMDMGIAGQFLGSVSLFCLERMGGLG
jgi:hypothetical protein